MIELATEPPQRLDTLDELFDALIGLIGRILLVQSIQPRVSMNQTAVRSYQSAGELHWVSLVGGSDSVSVDVGKPLQGEKAAITRLTLAMRISVLTDGVWTVVHEPEDWNGKSKWV